MRKTILYLAVSGLILSGCTSTPQKNIADTPSWVASAHHFDSIPFHYYGQGSGDTYSEAYTKAYSIAVEKYASWAGVNLRVSQSSRLVIRNGEQTFNANSKLSGKGQAFSQGLKVKHAHSLENNGKHIVYLVLTIDEADALAEKQRQKELLKPIKVKGEGVAYTEIEESGGIEIAKSKGEDVARSIATASLSLKVSSGGVRVASSLETVGTESYERLSISANSKVNNVRTEHVHHSIQGNTLITKVEVIGEVIVQH